MHTVNTRTRVQAKLYTIYINNHLHLSNSQYANNINKQELNLNRQNSKLYTQQQQQNNNQSEQQLVSSCSIQNNNQITQQQQLQTQQQNDNNENQISLKVYSWITIGELKDKISQESRPRIPPNLMRLFYKTMELQNSRDTLASYGLKKNMVIQMYGNKDYSDSKGDIRCYDIFTKNNLVALKYLQKSNNINDKQQNYDYNSNNDDYDDNEEEDDNGYLDSEDGNNNNNKQEIDLKKLAIRKQQKLQEYNAEWQDFQMDKLQQSFTEVESGFYYKIKPELTDEGTSGSYFLLNKERKKIAIFKPRDEEAYAPNNPRGYTGQLGQMGFRKGILSGESAAREVAAYLLDFHTSSGRHGVPITTFIEFFHPSFDDNDNEQSKEECKGETCRKCEGKHSYNNNNNKKSQTTINTQISPSTSTTKSTAAATTQQALELKNAQNNNNSSSNLSQICPGGWECCVWKLNNGSSRLHFSTKHGSLQIFKYHEGVVGDYGHSLFPVDEIHKIGILDIRIVNCDRNEENILIQKIEKTRSGTKIGKLIPIDHGLSLPSNLEILEDEISWMCWDGAKKPFSQENLDFIKNIDIDQNVKILRDKLKIREICLRNFKIVNMMLKKYAAKGYTLYQIGQILYREDDEIPSKIEEIVEWAETMWQVKQKVGMNLKMKDLINKCKKGNTKNTLYSLKKRLSKDSQNEKKTYSTKDQLQQQLKQNQNTRDDNNNKDEKSQLKQEEIDSSNNSSSSQSRSSSNSSAYLTSQQQQQQQQIQQQQKQQRKNSENQSIKEEENEDQEEEEDEKVFDLSLGKRQSTDGQIKKKQQPNNGLNINENISTESQLGSSTLSNKVNNLPSPKELITHQKSELIQLTNKDSVKIKEQEEKQQQLQDDQNLNQNRKNTIQRNVNRRIQRCASLPNLEEVYKIKTREQQQQEPGNDMEDLQNAENNNKVDQNNSKKTGTQNFRQNFHNQSKFSIKSGIQQLKKYQTNNHENDYNDEDYDNENDLNDDDDDEEDQNTGNSKQSGNIWDECFYECIENAMDIVIGAKNQDIPDIPELLQQQNINSNNKQQQQQQQEVVGRKSRYMSEQIFTNPKQPQQQQ